jgi:hypothetical protein
MEQEIWPIAIGGGLIVGFIILAAFGIRIAIVIWSYKIGKRKGQELAGILLGIFLGWIGLIIVCVLPDESKSAYSSPGNQIICPHCSKGAPREARFCPHCGNTLE